MEERRFLNNQIAEIVRVTPRQVISWTEKGLVEPLVEAGGAGTKREYSYYNLLEFGISKHLLRQGVGVQMVKTLLTLIRDRGHLRSWVERQDKETCFLVWATQEMPPSPIIGVIHLSLEELFASDIVKDALKITHNVHITDVVTIKSLIDKITEHVLKENEYRKDLKYLKKLK
jgi:DNA-binding transcriptional MerR regulator